MSRNNKKSSYNRQKGVRFMPLDTKSLPATIPSSTPLPKLDVADVGCKVVRKKVDSVILYEIKENELDVLEKGRQSDIFLNFSIFCFSTMLSCFVALLTSNFDNNFTRMAFFCVVVIGFVLGLILSILWWRGKDSVKDAVKIIRERKSDSD